MHAMRVPLAVTFAVAACVQAAAASDEFVLRDHLTLSASDRVRGEFVSWFDPGGPKSNNNYNFFANRLRVGTTLSFPLGRVRRRGPGHGAGESARCRFDQFRRRYEEASARWARVRSTTPTR